MRTSFNPADIALLSPLFLFIVGGLLLVLAEAFATGKNRRFLMHLTVLFCGLSALASVLVWKRLAAPHIAFSGMLVVDKMGCFFNVLFATTTGLTAMIAAAHQDEHDWQSGEFYGILLLAASGMSMLAFAGDLVTIFLGIETMSISAYVLIALRRKSRRSSEGALKYFLMGAFATGFLLYGIALIYGATGTTNLTAVSAALAEAPNNPIAVVGVLFLVVAFGFKVSAVPFHMWAPDAYEGAPTPVTGFMASAVKAAAFVAVLRTLLDGFGGDVMPAGRLGWAAPLAILAALTMTVANIAALRQENIKRMLAYSSISHAGLLLVGVCAAGLHPEGGALSSILYYLVAYSLTTLGAFAVITYIGGRGHERVLINDWAGFASVHPGAALAMTICMLSLAGIPPTGGFLAKFYVLKSAMEVPGNEYLWLVVVGALNSAISIVYYLRVVMAMYFRAPLGEFRPVRTTGVVFAMVACSGLALAMGLAPGWWLSLASL